MNYRSFSRGRGSAENDTRPVKSRMVQASGRNFPWPIRPLAATHRDIPAAAARAKAAHPSRRALRRGPHPSLPAARRDIPAAMAKAVRPSKALTGRAPLQPRVASRPRALLPARQALPPRAPRQRELPGLQALPRQAARQEVLPALRAPVPLVLPQQALWQKVLPALPVLQALAPLVLLPLALQVPWQTVPPVLGPRVLLHPCRPRAPLFPATGPGFRHCCGGKR